MNSSRVSLPDLICLSHLRWNFVFQRPQHLMSRYAATRRVYFVEEAEVDECLDVPDVMMQVHGRVTVVVPQLPARFTPTQARAAQRSVLTQLISTEQIDDYVLWYYTPSALRFSDHLRPSAVVYDCMDELSAFKGADRELPALERALFRRADLVLTGGHSLYDAKRHLHHNIHAMPSSVDVDHFMTARQCAHEPVDQQTVPGPRLGFFGVLDERLDIGLLAGVADARPDWQLVMVGPIVKIDPGTLPRRPNIHYLGAKPYSELPAYIAGWDVALLLFARNEATRFISPTKTPEYLAAGKPVVSTSIRDVVQPYGHAGLVQIADDVSDFVAACARALTEHAPTRRARADAFLQHTSWDKTWTKTTLLLERACAAVTELASPRPTVVPGVSIGA